MRFSFGFLIRLTFVFLCGLTGLAILLGSLAVPESAQRILDKQHPMAINGFFFPTNDRGPRFLDPNTGAMQRLVLPEGNCLEQASCSPWHDASGRTQVVGRWSFESGRGADAAVKEFGLARFSLPDCSRLDRIITDIVPNSPPCWYPGTSARILFSASDGWLYSHAFEAPGDALGRGDAEPRPLSWPREQRPGMDVLSFADPFWPSDPKFDGLVFVSLSFLERSAWGRQLSRSQIWWLRLSADGMAVKAAGRLTVPDPDSPDAAEVEERFPVPIVTPEGQPIVAYMSFIPTLRRSTWRLHVAPIVIDEQARAPVAPAQWSRLLADDCLPVRPGFSEDAGSITFLHTADGQVPEVRKLAVGALQLPPRTPPTLVRARPATPWGG